MKWKPENSETFRKYLGFYFVNQKKFQFQFRNPEIFHFDSGAACTEL